MLVHSLSAQAGPRPCETITGRPRQALRPYVAGYAGFRAGPTGPLRRRVLPFNLTTLVIDFAGRGSVVSGPRSTPLVYERTAWRHGVSIGLTPAGVSAYLGMPMRELAGAIVPLEDLLGHRAERLADLLGGAPDWATRFAILDDHLAGRLRSHRPPDGPVTRAWWRLQGPAAPATVGDLAGGLGVSRRHLEAGFREQIGLSPKTVARISRFQHAVHVLSGPAATLGLAVACGFADQPHFTREIRAMTGITPTELCAFLQYSGRFAD